MFLFISVIVYGCLLAFFLAVFERVTDAGCTEVRTAHCAVVGVHLVAGLVVFECAFRIESQIELVLPAEIVTSLAQRIVANSGTRMTLSQVGSMSGNLLLSALSRIVAPG